MSLGADHSWEGVVVGAFNLRSVLRLWRDLMKCVPPYQSIRFPVQRTVTEQ